MSRQLLLLLSLLLSCKHGFAAPAEAALSGTLTSVGSDTLGNLMTRWAEAFQQLHPGVIVQVQTPGSSSAPIALTAGAASFGAMSREMHADELQRFEQRYGYAPTRISVAQDAIVVFVHPDNPLQSLRLLDIAAIFGEAGACSSSAQDPEQRRIEHWNDLDVVDSNFAAQRLLRIGRNGVSGTSAYFSEATLCGADYRADIVQLPGSGAVVAAVAQHTNAIGYSGIGYLNALVKPLALSTATHTTAVSPNNQTIESGTYPLSRSLYLYFNMKPETAPSVLLASFFRFILSAPGQGIATREGFLALSAEQRTTQLTALHLAQ
ncbi:PstS family phosphate ABC transporter substrate-binding protein [Pseudolysobacter antarcticus]|uniref:PstS family phosphate ABC transporter substrate-binding protein n=1 Tax=Pseudolysobacter antarcticus TaxID=2511995 RepID=A0A411HK62_9GAMM|nr:PstS family phosphate ABC transporter substrate-binding protein [Pseudolysobacter antarcticus]QBB70929.1 PstS family phosphate ABC transporter substrate-binding protein [Pseudolysobacter antarcticus]